MTQPNGAVPITVQPSPTPEQWTVSTIPANDGSTIVVVRIASCTGMHVSFMDATSMQRIAEQMLSVAKTAQSGLTIPGPGFVLPPGVNGHDHRKS